MMLQKEHLLKLRRATAKVLAFATLFNATMLGNFISAPIASADELPEVILSEIIPDGSNDRVEFYSLDLAGEELPEGWQLSNEGDEPVSLSGSFNEYGLMVINFGNFFNDNRGDLLLSYNGISKDSISWGNNLTADLPPSQDGKSLSRIGESGWYSNTPVTEDLANDYPEILPDIPGSPSVLADEDNPEDYINDSSRTAVSAQVLAFNASKATIRFFDEVNDHIGDTDDVIDGMATVTKDLSTLNDGSISMRSFSRNEGIYSPWGPLGIAIKDTAEPAATTFDQEMVYTNENPVSLSGSAELGSIVRFYSWDEENEVVGEEVLLTADGNSSFNFNLPISNLNGANNFVAQVIDAAGNKSAWSNVLGVTHDDIAPTAPQNLEATHNKGFSTVTLDWIFDSTEGCESECSASPIEGFNIYSSDTDNFDSSDKIGGVDADTKTFTTTAFDTGKRYFVVTAVDAAGNESVYSASVSVLVAGLKSEQAGTPENPAVFGEQGLSLTPSMGMPTFTVVGYDNNLPGGEVPEGIAFIGNYFDIEVDNATAFPVNIKFYYTDEQLEAAGLKEEQLQGLYFYDEATDSWMLYGDTGVSTADIDGTEFSGYAWAIADHFTPIAIGGDNTPPPNVTGFKAVSRQKAIELTWNKVAEDAVAYAIEYRPVTHKGDDPYISIRVDGVNKTKISIDQLENGVGYEFRIWAEDAVGNRSLVPQVAINTPNSIPSDDLVLPTKDPNKGVGGKPDNSGEEGGIGGEVNPQPDNTVANNPDTDTDSDSPDDADTDQDESDIKGDQDSQEEASNSSRALVTFLIIIAAGAAGFGGYYAYQWWIDRPTEKTQVQVTEKSEKKKKHHRDRRW